MSKEAPKQVTEPSVADWLLNQLHQNPVFLEIQQTHQILDRSEFNEIHVLIHRNDGNNIPQLIKLLEEFIQNVGKTEPLGKVTPSIQTLLNELIELRKNVEEYGVTITSALDGYTLNKTSRLISKLNHFIKDLQELLPKREAYPLSEEKMPRYVKNRVFSFQKTVQRSQIPINQKDLAEKLKLECEEIRSLIGSPETMPRGLIILLAMNISQTLEENSKISDEVRIKVFYEIVSSLQSEEYASRIKTQLIKFLQEQSVKVTGKSCSELINFLENNDVSEEFTEELLYLANETQDAEEFCENILNLLLKEANSLGDTKQKAVLQGNTIHVSCCKKLKQILKNELEHIRAHYPDLAEAGEKLQKANEQSKLNP